MDNLLFQTDVSTTKDYVKTSTFNDVIEIDICGIVSDPGLKCCNLNTSSCNGNIPFERIFSCYLKIAFSFI